MFPVNAPRSYLALPPGLGPADSGYLPRTFRTAVRRTSGDRCVAVHWRTVRCGPTDQRLQCDAARRRPLVPVIRARRVAVRPSSLVDREAAVAVTRIHRAVRGRLALP